MESNNALNIVSDRSGILSPHLIPCMMSILKTSPNFIQIRIILSEVFQNNRHIFYQDKPFHFSIKSPLEYVDDLSYGISGISTLPQGASFDAFSSLCHFFLIKKQLGTKEKMNSRNGLVLLFQCVFRQEDRLISFLGRST